MPINNQQYNITIFLYHGFLDFGTMENFIHKIHFMDPLVQIYFMNIQLFEC